MKLPQNTITSPSLEDIENFCDLVTSISAEARRALNAVAIVGTIEAAAKVSGVGILEIPGVIGGVANCRPRDDLLEFDPRSASFVFKRRTDGEAFATIQRFVTAFTKWSREPLVMDALGAAERHRQEMFEARRVAA